MSVKRLQIRLFHPADRKPHTSLFQRLTHGKKPELWGHEEGLRDRGFGFHIRGNLVGTKVSPPRPRLKMQLVVQFNDAFG